MEYPEYARYLETMRKLGFRSVGGGTFEGEGENQGSEVETWKKGDLVVDVMPQALEPGIDISLSAVRKRASRGVKVRGSRISATVRGIR
jgi:hypothetical protein